MSNEKVSKTIDYTRSSNPNELLEIRVNYALRLYESSRREDELSPELQIGFRKNIESLPLEERAEVLRYLEFKARNLDIIGDKKERARYIAVADYLYLNFIEG